MSYGAAPVTLETPMCISIASSWSGWANWHNSSLLGVSASGTGPAANLAIYVPIVVTSTVTFTRGFWYNGSVATAAGNVCVGLYLPDTTRVATTGAVAAAGNSVVQSAAFSASYDAAPGQYYMAISYSASGANSAFIFSTGAISKMTGTYQEAVGSHPLPANATFATWSGAIMPVFGITRTSFAI